MKTQLASNPAEAATASQAQSVWSVLKKVLGVAVALLIAVALGRLLAFKWLFNTTSGFLTSEFGISDYAALGPAILLSVLATAAMVPVFAYFAFGRKPAQAFASMIALAAGTAALAYYAENRLPERVHVCEPTRLVFFNRKGVSLVYYARVNGRYEFFSRSGVHPQRGVPLQPVPPRLASQIVEAYEAGSIQAYDKECQRPAVAAAETR